jgi:predicted PurR-regulated permease PerM
MERKSNMPFFVKMSHLIMGLVGFFFILCIGREILMPLVLAAILAILLNPLVNFLQAKKVNRVVAIVLSMLAALLLTSALIYFIISQTLRFSDSFPILEKKFDILLNQLILWISETFHVSILKIDAWLVNLRGELTSSGSAFIGKTLITVTNFLIIIFLIPVYVIMILYYKPLLLQFVKKLFPNNSQETVADILYESKFLIQNYLVGLLAEALIMAILNSVGLLALGIEYAILMGIIGAILNVIPYIGGITSTLLPMAIAITTKSPASALYVLLLYSVIQFIDNHYIVPYIVASRVRLNALVSIVVVLIGAAMWGVPGMFLSIPMTAIMKVIFDRIEPLKPYGFLLGDTMPPLKQKFFTLRKKKTEQVV